MNNAQNQEEGATFPEGFLWGVATAGYQVEGGIENNDWHLFAGSPLIKRRVERLSSLRGIPIPDDAVQHGNLDVLREDLDRATLLGLNSYRFSIEWSRIPPQRPAHPGQPLSLQDADLECQGQGSLGSGAKLILLAKWY